MFECSPVLLVPSCVPQYKRRTPSISHHILCTENGRMDADRRAQIAPMRTELGRVCRLATAELAVQKQSGKRGVMNVIEGGDASSAADVAFQEELPGPSGTSCSTPSTSTAVVKHFGIFANAGKSKALKGAEPSPLGGPPASQVDTEQALESPAITAAVESPTVTAAVAVAVTEQSVCMEQMQEVIDALRAGSVASPHLAAWMKRLVHERPLPPGSAIEQPLSTLTVDEIVCPTTGRILRPWPLQQLLRHLTHLHIDLVSNPLFKSLLMAHGMETPLCMECNGPTEYLGDSLTIESGKATPTKTGGIKTVLYPNGLHSPLTSGVSCCISSTCSRKRQPFDHIELLARLPPSVTACIPIDADGSTSGQTLLHRDVLRPSVMDMHLGEGPSSVADEKYTKMGARLVTEAVNAVLDLGQAWMNDLELLVGDNVWRTKLEDEQLRLAPLRAELLVAEEQPDKLGLMAPGGKALAKDVAGLYVLPARAETVRTAVLNVYESKSQHRRAEAAAVGAAIKLSLDFSVQPGKNVGEKFLLTVKNENGQTVGKFAGATSNYLNYETQIREIGARENVTAELLCIDDLMENEVGEYAKHAQRLMEWTGTKECILDRFHVVHRVNEVFNNHHLDFYDLMVVKQRDVVASRDGQLEKKIDARLRDGTLNKSCTFRGKSYKWGDGVKMTLEEINEHKRTGLYHAMLSSTGALVPVIPNPRKHVDDFYPLWQAEVSEAIRRCSTATSVALTIMGEEGNTQMLLLPRNVHVHSWPGAPPAVHTCEVPFSSVPQSADGVSELLIMDGMGGELLKLHLMTGCNEALESPMLSISTSVSSTGGNGSEGRLAITIRCQDAVVSEEVSIPTKATDVTDAKGQLLCDWETFERRTTLGAKRYRLCSLQKLTHLRTFRETTLDANEEMQHESLISTASNEHTHRRLAEHSGRGRGQDLACGSMIEGDYIDSRRAAVRHAVPGCGADVEHDELQLAALTNALAGFDITGTASGAFTALMPQRPYDYDVPRAASPNLILVKQLNRRKQSGAVAQVAASQPGSLALPTLQLRGELSAGSGTVKSSQLPASAQALRAKHVATCASAAAATLRKQQAAVLWTPLAGCDCGSREAHAKHVRKCATWVCTCKPPKVGRGGDKTHDPACMRSRYAQHVLPYVAPKKGDKLAMLWAARRCGCPDVVHAGRAGWVPDPDGRPVIRSTWDSAA